MIIALWGIHSYYVIAAFGFLILFMVGYEDCKEEIRKEREAKEKEDKQGD